MIDFQNEFHMIDYVLLEKWSQMTLKDLQKEQNMLKSKIDIIPESSGSVSKSMKKVLSALEIFINYREIEEKASKSRT